MSMSSLSHQSITRWDSISNSIEDDSFIFVSEAHSIPKNPDQPTEDAYFLTKKGLGVSDGVGGWNNYGIDSSLFSNALMQECKKFI